MGLSIICKAKNPERKLKGHQCKIRASVYCARRQQFLSVINLYVLPEKSSAWLKIAK